MGEKYIPLGLMIIGWEPRNPKICHSTAQINNAINQRCLGSPMRPTINFEGPLSIGSLETAAILESQCPKQSSPKEAGWYEPTGTA